VIGVGILFLATGFTLEVSELTTNTLVSAPMLVFGGVLSQLVSTTLPGILKPMMYVYATETKTPAEFNASDLDALLSRSTTVWR
jgi:hypothetical protein